MTQQELETLKAAEQALWAKVTEAEKTTSKLRNEWSAGYSVLNKAIEEMRIEDEVLKRLEAKGVAS